MTTIRFPSSIHALITAHAREVAGPDAEVHRLSVLQRPEFNGADLNVCHDYVLLVTREGDDDYTVWSGVTKVKREDPETLIATLFDGRYGIETLDAATEEFMDRWAHRCDITRAKANEDGATGFYADDGNAEAYFPHAKTRKEAAQAYVDGGDWNDPKKTTWIHVWTWPAGEPDSREEVIITVDPKAPACAQEEHNWCSPIEVVGGIKQNPGVWGPVWGSGGGVIMKEVCEHCGLGRVTDTWAQDPDGGRQGLTSIHYTDALLDLWRAWKNDKNENDENDKEVA